MKLLRVLHIDVALLGLIEKLSLGLVKRLEWVWAQGLFGCCAVV